MKKFKLLGFTLLASSLALSSCMLLPKKKTDTGSSSSSDTGSGSDTPAATDWTDTVKNEMKQYLDGEVIPFISGSWTWEYQSDYGCYCGTSKDTTPATAAAAFESGWNKSLDENEGMLSKIHNKGAITIELYDDEGTTTLDCYFDEEASSYSSETEASMIENFGEALPFPAGTWAGPYATWYGAYYLQSAHSYNYSSIKSSYESKGYKFYIDEEYDSEYFYKQTSLGYICGWLQENTDLKLGYVYFYFSEESPVSGTFELKSDKTTALTGENVTLTIERDNVDVEAVTYTVSPASAVTEVSKDNNGAVYTINVTEKTEITFTAKQGEDYESSVKVTAYKEYPKPTSIEFKKSSYSVEQGKSLDLSKEFTVLPEDATGYTLTYSATGNEGVSVSSAGVVSATSGASTSQTATIKVSYSETVYATCTVNVTEPAKEVTVTKTVEQLATTYSWANGTQYASFKLDDNVSVSATTDGDNAKYYSANQDWRIYHSNNGSFTISVPDNCQLISITITFNSKNSGTCKGPSGNEITSGTAVSVSGTSATFTADGGESGKTNGQIRVTAFSVTYK